MFAWPKHLCTYALSNHLFIQTNLVTVLYSIAGQKMGGYLKLVRSFPESLFVISCTNTQGCPMQWMNAMDEWCQRIFWPLTMFSSRLNTYYSTLMTLWASTLGLPTRCMHLFTLFVLVKGLSSFGQILSVCEYKHIMMLYSCVQSTIQLQAQPCRSGTPTWGYVFLNVYGRLPTVCWLSYNVPAAESWHQT